MTAVRVMASKQTEAEYRDRSRLAGPAQECKERSVLSEANQFETLTPPYVVIVPQLASSGQPRAISMLLDDRYYNGWSPPSYLYGAP